MIKQVKNEKIQQNTLFLETAESPWKYHHGKNYSIKYKNNLLGECLAGYFCGLSR